MIQRADGTWDIINRIILCVNIIAGGCTVAHPSPAKAGAGIGRRVEWFDSRGNAVNCGTANANR